MVIRIFTYILGIFKMIFNFDNLLIADNLLYVFLQEEKKIIFSYFHIIINLFSTMLISI